MTKPPRSSLVEFMSENFLDKELNALSFLFKKWSQAEGRGHQHLRDLLGTVYEVGAKVDGNRAAKSRLIGKANEDPTIRGNNRWIAEKKSGSELLLAVLLGVTQESKVTRSQWLGALRAAKKADVEPDKVKCAAWFDSVGGVHAAHKSLVGGRDTTALDLRALVARLHIVDDDEAPTFIFPEIMTEGKLPERIGLVIIRETGPNRGTPLFTLSDEKLIVRAMQSVLRAEESHKKEVLRSIREEEKSKVRNASKSDKARWSRYRKVGDYDGTFLKFVLDGCPEI
jgi:hypothetical protein